MKAEDLRKLSVEKIEEQLDDAREKLMKMRFQIATGELKDQNLPRLTRRDIARMETILRQKRAEKQPAQAKTEGEA
jgi:large subunit ribosomal protein L29